MDSGANRLGRAMVKESESIRIVWTVSDTGVKFVDNTCITMIERAKSP